MLTIQRITRLFADFTMSSSTEELWSHLVAFCEEWDLLHLRLSIYNFDDPIEPDYFLHVRAWPPKHPLGRSKTWAQYYIDERMYDHDRSFHLIFEHKVSYMFWTAMEKHVRASTEASRVFTEMRDFGIGEGVLIGNSCGLRKKTVLLGLAGPSKAFLEYKGELWAPLLHVMQTWNKHYLDLGDREGILISRKEKPVVKLSPRELEVIRLLSKDLETEEIAEQLNITISGVKGHLRRVREKSGCVTRAGMVAFALRTGQIS